MRSTSVSLSMLALAASVGAAVAADMPVKAPPVAPEKIEYGNLYFGVDWNSHRSLAGYMGVCTRRAAWTSRACASRSSACSETIAISVVTASCSAENLLR
jgi:hypothetical protein